MPPGPLFKIKLASGRILGPLDLERVRALILKNQVVGTETAREYPTGEWVDINAIPTIAELLVARADGRLVKQELAGATSGYSPLLADAGLFSTQVLPGAKPSAVGALEELTTSAEAQDAPPTAVGEEQNDHTVVLDSEAIDAAAPAETGGGDDDKTSVYSPEDDDKTHVASADDLAVPSLVFDTGSAAAESEFSAPVSDGIEFEPADSNLSRIASEKTVIFQRSEGTGVAGASRARKPKNKTIEMLKATAVALALGLLGYQLFLDDGSSSKPSGQWQPIRPQLPLYNPGNPKPEESNRVYLAAMHDYVLDNVVGYEQAANKLLQASSYDKDNVKALAMLASSYLNLIDSSNKDENYFAVIYKLIDLSRAKKIDLPETVIADVEFFIMANKAEAAENRIVEYTKNHSAFGPEMYYYLALAFYERGDAQSAARYVGAIPENKAFSPRVFYLRGQIAEKLGDSDAALKEYDKGVRFSGSHAKSRLKIAELLNKRSQLKDAAAHLDYLVTHTNLLAPKDMAEAYYLHAQLSQEYGKPAVALGDMERASRLDKDNHDYLLELYTLRAKAGDTTVKNVQQEARMYFFLSEGEKLLRLGKSHEALIQFMQANEANPEAPLPFVKIGDMFRLQNDIGNAMINYRKAANLAPQNIEVWSKYINTLIQGYEWDEAKKAMDKFRNLPVPQSSIDKLTADWYEKQGMHAEAQMYYKKAMARESIDPDVYIAFAKSLMGTHNYKEAPFFFALALRFDPLNVDAILGTAKCIAATDSIDRAISMLQDELSKGTHPSAEMLSAIAELDIQKGDWDLAQQNIDQARAADPDLAQPWKLQAQVYMNRKNTDKTALDQAAAAYQSYSERNPSDPTGYVERYRIYLEKTDFEKAGEELTKIFGLFPKFPRLHYYKGWLYSQQGNHRAAGEEYRKELANNPGNVDTLVQLGKELLETGPIAGTGGAQEILTQAMQLAPTNAEAKQQAGYAAYLLKNYQAAIALYNAALVYDRANPMIYKRQGMAYRDMGDPTGARAAFHKYLEMEPDAPDRAQFERYR